MFFKKKEKKEDEESRWDEERKVYSFYYIQHEGEKCVKVKDMVFLLKRAIKYNKVERFCEQLEKIINNILCV